MTALLRCGRMLGVCLRGDGVRPASVLAAATAVTAALLVTTCRSAVAWPRVACASALVAGGLAAAAAIGDPPRGVAGPTAAWIGSRCLWPALGWIGGSVAVVAGGVDPRSLAGPAGFAMGGLVAVAAAVAAGCFRGLAPAEATGLATASVMAAAAATGLVPAGAIGAAALASVAALAIWLAIVGGVLVSRVPHAAETEPSVATVLGATAMVTTLGGMVLWLFLTPEHAGRYTLLVAAWFVTLAVPQVTLGWGSCDEALRRRLLPSSVAPGWRTAFFHAAILGWPLLVAAVLAGDPALAAERLVIVLLVAFAAAVTAATTSLVVAAGGTRDTAQATVLTLAVMAGGAAAAAPGFQENPAGNDVEQSGHTCKTPVSMPPDAAPPPCLEESFRARHRFM